MSADSKSWFDESTAAQQRFVLLFLRRRWEFLRYCSKLGIAGLLMGWFTATAADLWNDKELGAVTEKLTETINSHGAGLYRLQPQN